jgi:hypothetical protein
MRSGKAYNDKRRL